MKKSRTFSYEKPYLAALGILLSIGLSSAAVQYTDLDPWMLNSYARIISTAILTMVVCGIAFKNRRTMIAAAGILVLGVVTYAAIPSDSGIKLLVAEESPVFFSWLADFVFRWEIGMEMPESHVYVMTVAITVLVTMSVYFSVVKRLFFWPVFAATTALFTAQWVVTREVNRLAFYISFAVVLTLYLLHVRKMRKKGISKTGRRVDYLSLDKFIISAIPVVAAVLLVTLMIPKSPEPIEWKWLDDRIKYRDANAYKSVDYKSYDHFSLAMAGFSSEPGMPGGPVIPDYSHVLDVYSEEILYLRGESWPYFDGTRWGSQSEDANYSETMEDYGEYDAERKMLLEAVYGWRFMDLGEWLASGGHKAEGANTTLPGPDFSSVTGSHLLPGWFTLNRASVAYKGVETKTLFSPMNSMITADTEGLPKIFVESDATLDTEERIRLNTFVNFDYLSLDRDDENYLDIVRKSRNGLYEEIYSHLYYITRNSEAYENLVIESTMHDTLADLFELYIEAETNNWRYTAVPDDMPARVSKLTREITKGLGSDYDKVKSIEEYFNEGFTYTLNAEAPPADRDFTDWFLFDYKKGYCTYYATAMSMMVRSIGIPARYVEGFVTPAVSSEGDRYTVLNSNAHAWVEVYFEGVGWVNFEPTPPFAAILNKEDGSDITIGEDMLENPDMEDYMEELNKYENMPAFGTGDGYRGDSGGKAWATAAMVVGAWLAACLAVTLKRKIFFKRINSIRRFKKGYFKILRIVRVKGLRRDGGETLMELAEKIDEAYYMAHVSMKQLTLTYYGIMYSEKEIPVDRLREMEVFYREFRKEFNSEVRFPEWVAYRILFPLI